MIHFNENYKKIEEDFICNGIVVDKPGFYDQKNFMNIEKINPKYLCNYARFVQTKKYSDEYIAKARKEIPFICELVYKELVKDGRKGACIDASMAISRILEKEGFWNYIVKGAVTLKFPLESGISTKHFWPIDNTQVDAAHVWVVSPPFNIIDITIKQQHYHCNEANYLPEFIMEESINEAKFDYKDIISLECREYCRQCGIRNSEMLQKINPNVIEFSNVFKANLIKYNATELKYIPVAASAPDLKLEDMRNLYLNGNYGIDIYRKIIKPELQDFRQAH